MMKNSLSTKPELPPSIWLQIHPTLGVSMMDHLFNKLDAMYPIRWKSAHSSEISVKNWRDTWAEAFDEERIQPHQVKAGIAECRKLYDWPPSLTEFIKACRAVKPAAHRDFAPMLTHKMTKEAREANLRRLQEVSKRLFSAQKVGA